MFKPLEFIKVGNDKYDAIIDLEEICYLQFRVTIDESGIFADYFLNDKWNMLSPYSMGTLENAKKSLQMKYEEFCKTICKKILI